MNKCLFCNKSSSEKACEKCKANKTIVYKGWGYEDILVNNSEYCGKVLFVQKNKKCSYHYHILKDETFFIQEGSIMLRFGWNDNIEEAQTKLLEKGDTFHVSRNLRHQFEALEDSYMIEFSTQHFDSDSYRIIKGD